jgi:lipopolysaccharide/colanic/teichoic acid biosynthesis glycosyltransferase
LRAPLVAPPATETADPALDALPSMTAADAGPWALRQDDRRLGDPGVGVDPVAPPPTLRAVKRGMDILGALAGLVVLGPFLAGVAILIAAIDGRPVLFRQVRAGRDGVPFEIVKFRTMERDADAQREALRTRNEVSGAAFKMDRDPRVTRLGTILRRTSVDELPQLWNVLVGDMSLVGPRPHPFDDVARYEPWHHRRLRMKPGLTGLWQISSRGDPDFDRWVELDLRYIHGWSLARDVAIVMKTIPAVLRGTGR